MITADQVMAHMIGDYVVQSDWMARHKTKEWVPAFWHAVLYSVCFLVFKPSFPAFLVIMMSHYFIDRYSLARYVVYAKNMLLGDMFVSELNNKRWKDVKLVEGAATLTFEGCHATGFGAERPVFLTVWLLIIVDNIIHILINGLALKYL